MKLAAPWVQDDAVQQVCAAIAGGGHGVWFVGGCVRNALIGAGATDIDITTDARPDRVTALAEAAGLRVVPTGITHGTVTIIAQSRPFEVTTLRRDVATDGRHATVAFAETLAEDAGRRDFTINALYATPDGTVVDPLGGMVDLLARRVRFIGAAQDRIREDYLRILRFFRFHAWFADPDGGIDAEGLAACAADLDGLARLSRERVGAEMRKLLAAPDPAPAVAAMAVSGVLAHLLPGASALLLPVLVHVEQMAALPPDPIRRLAALGGEGIAEALRLSRAEAARLEALRDAIGSGVEPGELGYRHGAAEAVDVLALRAAAMGLEIDPVQAEQARFGATQTCPVRAADLPETLKGPAIGARLREVEARWIASGFTLDRAALLR
ncbi:MAG: CCA tRNA nucleotidyltransferase [Rhodobacterales bacterium]|nr:CCA tRNA nucleotidyltransferase [Rhodobacterales bacterium]NCT12976.1 CCA tRNA nucleotidyltransferase [Rhodobacterales bacterium]